MYIDTTFPPDGSGRLAQFMRGVQMLDSIEIGLAVDALIDKLDQLHGDSDLEDDDRAGVLMIAPGVDYDPALDIVAPDGLPGDPVDAEDDDPAGTLLERGEGAAWIECEGYQPDTMRAGWSSDREDDEDDDSDRCAAGDDHMIAGPVMQRAFWQKHDERTGCDIGDADDREDNTPPAWQIDQTRPLYLLPGNDA
jgi:hypothetical protein